MKITVVTGPSFPVPPLQGGAIARLWQGLSEQFVRQGHEVTIVCRAWPSQPAKEVINGVRYLRWGGYAQSVNVRRDLVLDFIYAAGVVWRLPPADIVVINDFWLPVFAGMFRRRAGLIVINSARYPKRQIPLYRATKRFAACSNVIRDAIIAQYPSAAPRVRVLPNPIDTEALHPPAVPRANARKTILFVGRIHPEKGVHVLVSAFAQLCQDRSDVRLRLVGPHAQAQGGGGDDYLNRLKQSAGSLSVEFPGPTFDFSQLAGEYRAADIFCYPSLAEKGEALPVAPLEAMATGLAPVVSDLKCFNDYIVDGECGFYFDHRCNAEQNLSATFARLLDDPARLATAGRRANEVAQQLSYPNVAKSFLDDFEVLRKENPR